MATDQEWASSLVLLFDPLTKLSPRLFYPLSERWFKMCGKEPNRVSFLWPGPTVQTVTFKRAQKTLKSDDIEKADWISFFTIPAGSRDNNDEKCVAALSSFESEIDFRSDFTNVREDWISIAKDMLVLGQIQYGYFFKLPAKLAPGTYAGGAIFSYAGDDAPPHEEELRSRWHQAMVEYSDRPRTTLLRQVYSLQILSKEHLALKIGRQSLSAWIKASAKHGVLQEIAPKLWAWTFDNKNDIYAANMALLKAKLLAAWDPKHASDLVQ